MRKLIQTTLIACSLGIGLFVNVSRAADINAPLLQMGLGTLSCATWLSNADNERRGQQWAFGFLTGMNVMAALHDDASMVGKGTDQPGFAAAIKKTCNEDPSKLLTSATVEVYLSLKNDNQ